MLRAGLLTLALLAAAPWGATAETARPQKSDPSIAVPARLLRQVTIFLRHGGTWEQAVALADDVAAAMSTASQPPPPGGPNERRPDTE